MHLPKCERACMYVSVSISTSISAHAITYSKWVIHKQAPVAYRRASSSREVYSGYIFFFKKKKIEGNDGKKKKQNIPEVWCSWLRNRRRGQVCFYMTAQFSGLTRLWKDKEQATALVPQHLDTKKMSKLKNMTRFDYISLKKKHTHTIKKKKSCSFSLVQYVLEYYEGEKVNMYWEASQFKKETFSDIIYKQTKCQKIQSWQFKK